MNEYKKSLSHYKRARKLIPNQSQTLSKAPSQFLIGKMPLFSKRAKGCYIWDVDGNKYIDYMGALGPIILGYADPITDNVVKKQLKDGIIFSQPHPLELEVAELLVKIIPSCEMVRFAKNGSDATSGAVRIARAYTSKDIILYCGYHGAQDWYIVITERNQGVPKILKKLIYEFKYNDLDSLKKLFKKFHNKVAAIIMEPTYYFQPKDNFLENVKKIAHKNKALLIFDEIITGFRWSLGGAQKYFGVTPDLSCFGKSMANGMPISCVVGKKKIMQKCEDVFFSMTYGGECLSLAAAKAVITFMHKNPGVLQHVWKMGRLLQNGTKKLIKKYNLEKYIESSGFPPRSLLHFYNGRGKDWPELKTLFQKYMIDQGILCLPVYWNITYAHKKSHINLTLKAIDRALAFIKDDILRKKVNKKIKIGIKPVFRR
ncbi:aminotransferase class III-fold pyridoxal phosphate-dependent enzyme [Patescibacteria group bacterium]|nr:aminotransferase class III-fold pyridoxal phosphate-dependent enzyme [Patescibacteria group bacterium]